MTDENGKSKGFGFVSFERHEDAQKVRLNILIKGTVGFLNFLAKGEYKTSLFLC